MTNTREQLANAMNDDEPTPPPSARIPSAAQTYGTVNIPTSIPRRNQPPPEVLQKSLIRADDGTLQYKQFKLTPTAIIFPDGEMSQDDWVDLGIMLTSLERSAQWWVGDWANRAHDVWGINYEMIASEFSYEIETLYTYSWVAREIEISIRNRDLSFSHHRLVAGMDESVRSDWLTAAAEQRWTLKQFKKAIAEAVAEDDDGEEDFVSGFTRQYMTFAKKHLAAAQRAKPSERQQIADMLEALANQIRSL